MVKTVVVPLDGSALADRALGPARWLADTFEVDLLLFRSTFALDPGADEQDLHRVIRAEGLERAGVEVSSGRSTGPAVVLAARGAPDAVICMATHGRTGVRATMLGSVADEVLRDLRRPMVLVGPAYAPRPPTPELLVCWDGSELSAQIAPVAIEWAAALGLTIRVVAVHREGEQPVLVDMTSPPSAAADELVAALRAADRPVELTELVGDDPARVVATYVEEHPVALVALTTQGRGGLAASALGRVAARLLSLSPRPLLVHHP